MEFYGANGTLYVGLEPPRYRLFVRNATERFAPGWHDWTAIKQPGPDATYRDEMRGMLARVRAWDTGNAQRLADAEAVFVILDDIFRATKGN